ncbi:hypothetical protein OHW97_01950 [Acinetobacter baumannii]|nr:hypothetical protein [Acinetobacter baumannii]
MNLVTYLLIFFGVIFLLLILFRFLNNRSNKLSKRKDNINILAFNDNQSAFEYAIKYMDNSIVKDKPVLALSSQKILKPSESIMIKVAGDPPFFAHASTQFVGDYTINEGDLLAVIPIQKVENTTSYMKGDERKEWQFLIVSVVNPKYHTIKNMWSIKKDFLRQ